MGIKQVTPLDDILRQIDDEVARYYNSLARRLALAGESALKTAREAHAYKDQTGNLTSSIGYRVVWDGKVLFESNFDVVKEGNEGAKRGRAYIDKLTNENRRGFVFIMVAGMEYAGYVEAMGLGAFDAATKTAERVVKKAVTHLGL